MHLRLSISMFAMFTLLGACGDDTGTSAGPNDTSGTTAAEPTTGSASSTTEGAPTTTNDVGGDPATTDGETTADPTTGTGGTDPDTGATSEAGTTAGEPDPAILAACAAYCGRWADCGLQPDLAACVAGCGEDLSGATGECKAANLGALECTTALTCDDLLASLDEGGPCSAEKAAAAEACDQAGCAESFLQEDTTCELRVECPNAPVQQMICDTQICTCLADGQQVGQCPADDTCADGDAASAKFASCCESP